jgi:iron uptake system component EfeO
MTKDHGVQMNRLTRAAALAAPALVACLLAACGDAQDAASTTAGDRGRLAFELTDAGCSPTSATVAAGPVTIAAANRTDVEDELELVDADKTVLGERENIAPGDSADLTLTLQPGRYAVYCGFQSGQRAPGTLTVTGRAVAAHGSTSAELDHAVEEYKKYVEGESAQLVSQTATFVAALKAGQLQRAKDLFGPTRVHYETIEPIAESFGDLDPEIDARVNDVADRSKWSGFHRIEQILWVKGTTAGTERYADKLLADVKTLHARIPGIELQAAQVANGAVGLLDEVSGSKITGEEDRYSHTDLADFQANLTGSREAFETLEPALRAGGDERLVEQVETQFAEVQRGLDRYRRDTPLGFALYTQLTPQDRRAFAQQLAALTEPLSQVAGKLVRQG